MMEVKIPEKCSVSAEENGEICQFFKSNYIDEDTWYSWNPWCTLYERFIKDELKSREDASGKDISYWYGCNKPEWCKAKKIIVCDK